MPLTATGCYWAGLRWLKKSSCERHASDLAGAQDLPSATGLGATRGVSYGNRILLPSSAPERWRRCGWCVNTRPDWGGAHGEIGRRLSLCGTAAGGRGAALYGWRV